MNNKKYNEIYEKMKDNSIGTDKKCKDTRRKVIVKGTIAAIVMSLSLACMIGCSNIRNLNTNRKEETVFQGEEVQFWFFEIEWT